LPDLLVTFKTLVAILAIVNPVGAIPVFLGLTGGQSGAQRKHTAAAASLCVGVTLICAAWSGDLIFSLFQIRLASFKAGGGILVLLMSISMLQAKISGMRQTDEEAEDARSRDNVAIDPLGIPLMAGPGAISLVIVNAQRSADWKQMLVLSAVIAAVAVVTWLALRSSKKIGDWLGPSGINIITRLMGLILAAVAVELIASGALELLPGLGRPSDG
jgi:multiple antibiotic resistance protein